MRTELKNQGYFKLIDKKSSFYAYAIPVQNEEELKEAIKKVKKKHKAKHYPYAYHITLNEKEILEKKSDDGEPSSTAGLPLKNLIEREKLTNCLFIVARTFGGVKLGTSGLRKAFKESAKLALEKTKE
jgi:putative IMPACT (imprinted ancient) family translation regulator